ncbi:tail protein [Streptomyces phage Salutena]|uniref:Minor tail protein n=1 Tax=Streptomyces phage Salutena TaxID=2767576 RepID=A0A7S6R769_9CAUD|nr:tail protein [Streptomyces phage Salutena]QOV06149.1 minor tail protein [Streptomyces phage Salutena]
MSISSYPFDGQAVSEGQYSYLFRELASHSGIADQVGGSGFAVQADGSGMNVKVNPGFAVVRGHAVQSTATETLTIAAASAATRYDRVVLRLDPTANNITLAVVQGTSGGGVPALTQTDTGVFEFPLATVTVPVGAATISAGNVTGEREYLGNTVGGWTTATRPKSPRTGRLGLNTSTNRWEFWDGTKWTDLAPTITWQTIEGAPASFPPASHTHPWGDVTGKPTTFPPSSHNHDWDQVTGKPSSFPPSSHSHTWNSITSKPSTFPPSSHSHSQYVSSTGTVSWANGSKQPHARSVSGSGTYYAVWVRGDGGFCKNTSSRRFKQNIRDHEVDADAVLNLRPVVYDRLPDEEGGDYARDEFGLVAEEVGEHLPEIVTRDEEGLIDTVRYDLLGVALIPVVQRQAKQISELEARLARLEAALS